jgi:hypothetical protein
MAYWGFRSAQVSLGIHSWMGKSYFASFFHLPGMMNPATKNLILRFLNGNPFSIIQTFSN